MAHKVTARQSAVAAATNVEVPAEVVEEIDGIYAHLREHPDQEGFVEFDSAEERLAWVAQVRAYCASRQAGILTFRQLPSKNLPPTQLRFKLSANLEANGSAQTQAETTANARQR